MTILEKHEVKWFKTHYGEESYCSFCGSSVDWEDCWDCGGEGYSYHDCGEDTCCCLDPQPNVVCDTCNGETGWYRCLGDCGKKKPTNLEVAAEVPGQQTLCEKESEKRMNET